VDNELKDHLAAIEDWLASHRINVRQMQGLSSDERKQLIAVNKSIQQLTTLGVSIPAELRQLKLQLSAKDVEKPVTDEKQPLISEVAELISALSDLAKTAKVVQNKLSISGRMPVAKQHFEVTLEELIEGGFLSPEDKLEFSWQKNGPVYEGKVLADGNVMVKTQSGWKRFKSLSAAATTIGKCSLNGWLHWRRVNADGTLTTLKDIRARYINEGGAA